MNNKRVILYTYFYSKWGLDDTVGFSCDKAVEWCGFKPDYHKNKINEQITTLLGQFVHNGYMEISGDIYRNNCNIATLIPDKFDYADNFALIYFDEIHKIKDFKNVLKDDPDINRMSAAILLLVLSYLRVNMLRRKDEHIGNFSDKPEFCYRHYVDIEADIGIKNRYISKAIKILDKLDIIANQAIARYTDEFGNWHTDVTMFVDKYRFRPNKYNQFELDNNYNYKQELQWGMDYIKEKKYLKKKFNQDTEGH